MKKNKLTNAKLQPLPIEPLGIKRKKFEAALSYYALNPKQIDRFDPWTPELCEYVLTILDYLEKPELFIEALNKHPYRLPTRVVHHILKTYSTSANSKLANRASAILKRTSKRRHGHPIIAEFAASRRFFKGVVKFYVSLCKEHFRYERYWDEKERRDDIIKAFSARWPGEIIPRQFLKKPFGFIPTALKFIQYEYGCTFGALRELYENPQRHKPKRYRTKIESLDFLLCLKELSLNDELLPSRIPKEKKAQLKRLPIFLSDEALRLRRKIRPDSTGKK